MWLIQPVGTDGTRTDWALSPDTVGSHWRTVQLSDNNNSGCPNKNADGQDEPGCEREEVSTIHPTSFWWRAD